MSIDTMLPFSPAQLAEEENDKSCQTALFENNNLNKKMSP